jgi:hypothetical protein
MPRRLPVVFSVPVATVMVIAILAGCSPNSSSAPKAADSTATATATGVPGGETGSTAPPKVLKISPGSRVTLAGSGCKPGAQVAAFAAASHASGQTVGQGTVNASGGFSITVTMPYMGEPEATLSAMCDNTAGTTIPATQLTIEYTSAG